MLRNLMLAGAVVGLCATSAAAGEQKSGQQAAAPAKRIVYVCDTSVETRRAFEREHGALVFVTAEEALRTGAWSTPRCMTQSEHRRLQEQMQQAEARQARIVQARSK